MEPLMEKDTPIHISPAWTWVMFGLIAFFGLMFVNGMWTAGHIEGSLAGILITAVACWGVFNARHTPHD